MDSKGTILYLGGFELPDRNAAAHRVLNNAKAFRDIGCNVVFCGVDKGLTQNVEEPVNIMGFDSFAQVYPQSTKQWIKQMWDITHYLKVAAKYNDIKYIFCYNLHAIPLVKILGFAKKNNIKVICDCTEWYENKVSVNPVKLIKFVDTQLCMRCLQKKCDGMIAISTYLENYYKKHIKNIVVVPPLVDVTEEKWLQEPTMESEKITFVYSGQPGDTKDKIGQIVESFLRTEKTECCKFKVVGITEEDFYKTYPSFTDQKKLISGFVEFCGRVSHIQSIAELKKADYSIFIRDRSRKNMAGFPTKFVESYTSGIRIIANDVSDIKKYFPENDGSILIKVNSVDSIESAINQALENNLPTKRIITDSPFDFKKWEKIFEKFLN